MYKLQWELSVLLKLIYAFFSSCLLNSSYPYQRICQVGTCCNVCYRETTLGKSGVHRSWLSYQNPNAVSAMKQSYNKNIG